MTKKERAIKLFTTMAGQDRKAVIAAFVEQLDMTPAGAGTYYYTCKNAVNGVAPKSYSKAPTEKKEKKADSRTMYTVCTPRDDGENGVVVDSTGSHFDLSDAKKRCKGDQIVVKGLPELDSSFAGLKAL